MAGYDNLKKTEKVMNQFLVKFFRKAGIALASHLERTPLTPNAVCPRAREEGMLHRDKCPTGIGLPTRARGGRLPDNGDASPFMRWAR